MVFEAASYGAAEELIRRDPMIARGLVEWTLHEWRPVAGDDLL